ncbi:MAG: alpha/beta hydrolase [Puniceicoccales bacterium]
MNYLTRCFITAFATLSLAASTASANWLNVVDYKEIEGGDNLTLHIATPPGHTAADKTPVIIFFFGGGWVNGKPGQFYPYIQDLSKKGIVAISAQYRTKSSHGVTPVECVQDGKSAIRYVREHAAELGIDPDKIIAGGGSAGAHVAACSVISDSPEDLSDNRSISARPQALVLLNPVLSTGPGYYRHGYIDQVTGDNSWRTLSPFDSIDANFPPTQIQVGTNDNVLPVELAERFEQAMTAEGIECDLVLYDGAKHGFFNKPEYRDQVVAKIEEFLRGLGYLQ